MHIESIPNKLIVIIPSKIIAQRFLTLDYSFSILNEYLIKDILL